MRRDNLNSPAIPEVFARLEALESAKPLESSSVSGGRLRFIGGLLRVDSGGRVEIVGTLEIEGTTTVSGTFNVDGPWSITGDGTITGDVAVTGMFKVNGPWEINGDGVLTGDLTVAGGGKVVVSGGSSPATLENGKMSFGTGGAVEADTGVGGVKMTAGDAVVNAGTTASIRKGSSSIIVGPTAVTINPAGSGDIDLLGRVQLDRSTIPDLSGTGLPANILIVDSSGYLRRTDGT